jgi:hypothetical protein
MKFKVNFYNINNIEEELDGLLKNTKLLCNLFNSSFYGDIDQSAYNEDKYLLQDLLTHMKEHFISLLILDKKANTYEIVPFIVLKSSTKIFVIWCHKNKKFEPIIKKVLQNINFDIASPKVVPIKDHELVEVDYTTGKSRYLFDHLLLINKNFYKISS